MAVEGDLLNSAKSFLPSFGSLQLIIFWVIVVLAIGIIIGGFMWWFMNSKKYSRKIPIYVEENGILRKIGIDRARIMTIDKGLAKIWYFKKKKMYSQPFIYTSSPLEYPAIQKADGDLINIQFKVDAEGKLAIARILPTSLRMANANIRRYLRENYKDQNFIGKWGGMILFISAMVLFILLSGWMVLEIVKKVGTVTAPLADASTKLADALSNVHCSSTAQVVTAG